MCGFAQKKCINMQEIYKTTDKQPNKSLKVSSFACKAAGEDSKNCFFR